MTDRTSERGRLRGTLLPVMACLALPGCAIHWPWKHKPKPAPQPVHYVTVVSETGAISEYWDRNTLQFDLTGLAGEGSATLSQIKSVGWPIRLEFLVRPGSFARLEVVGAQRVVYEVAPEGSNQGPNLVFKLAPDVYPSELQSLAIRWSATADSGH